MSNIDDPTNLTHLSDLVNQYVVSKNLDLEAIERDMIGTTGTKKLPNIDPNTAYGSTVSELAREIGINLNNNLNMENFDEPYTRSISKQKDVVAPAKQTYTETYNNNEFDEIDELDNTNMIATTNDTVNDPGSLVETLKQQYSENKIEAPDVYNNSPRKSPESTVKKQPLRARNIEHNYYDQQYQQYQPDNNYQNENYYQQPAQPQSYQQPYPQQYPQPYPQQYQNQQYQNQQYYDPNRFDPNYYSTNNGPDPYRSQLTNAMQAYSGMIDDQTMIKEQEEDTKSILLEDIDELKFELEDDGVDISRIPEVDQDSPLADVQKVHKMYKVKYIRRRYNDFGHEIILAGAQGLGYIFDGSRKIGPYKPNLVGWHNEVRTKLRRMRYETATIVSGIVQEYNIGPFSRLLFELVPSAVIYSNSKKNQHGQTNYTVDQYSQAIGELRDTV